MKRLFPKVCFIFFVLATLLSKNVFSAPTVLFKNVENKNLSLNAMPQSLVNVVEHLKAKNSNLAKIIVYQVDQHFILYLLSSKSWSIAKVRVDLDASGKVKNVISSYQENLRELHSIKNDDPVCPDANMQFVAISAFPDVGHTKQAVDAVYAAAKKRYNAIEILGDSADAQTYENWLSCPALKGFYSIGPGDNYELIVGNGDVVSWPFFQNDALMKLYDKTTFFLNSPFVFNFPFGSQLTFGSAMSKTDYALSPGPTAYELVAGYADLIIGTSEDVSACFATKAISGALMNENTLQACIGNMNFYYKNFQISNSGKIML